ncbi:helix-turn-helix transcriptional regulator [Streptomyces sp. Edi2]|uniref:helix-turn-helix domain-containing protein n=1 Tax=Streptomyces sp. Edi2 TaxID=3162528 RepID=UPI0033057690
MPARKFDPRKFRAARQEANKTQAAVAAELGNVKETAVAKWERDDTKPHPEMLPQLAEIVGLPLDALAPREGLRNLADLRCDAGLYLKDTIKVLQKVSPKTLTSSAVHKAEKKSRKLSEKYVEPLAKAYGVDVDVLLAAQERTWGNNVPDPATTSTERQDVPRTLSEKMRYLVDHTYGGGKLPPSDAEIARTINVTAGAVVISETGVQELRSGRGDDRPTPPEILDGLEAAYNAPEGFFHPDRESVVHDLAAALETAAKLRGVKIAARGGDGALSGSFLKVVEGLLDQIEEGNLPGISSDELD